MSDVKAVEFVRANNPPYWRLRVQFICHVCGEYIMPGHNGLLIWNEGDEDNFKIVHGGTCDDKSYSKSVPLDWVDIKRWNPDRYLVGTDTREQLFIGEKGLR